MHPKAAIHALLRAMPPDTCVVDEAVSNGHYLRRYHRWTQPGRMYSGKQIIGWGLGASIGISLAHDRRVPLLCVAGDGSALFGAQAMWSVAHERVPLVYAILVNREYGILKRMLFGMKGDSRATGSAVGVDLVDPEVDFVALAASMGLPASLIEHTDEIADQVERARSSGEATVLVIPVRSAVS